MFLMSFGFVIADWIIKKGNITEFEYIDSVTEEPDEKRPIFLKNIPYKYIFIIGLLFFGMTYWQTSTYKQSIVSAPIFQAFPFATDPVFLSLMSGIVGLIENLFFFGWMFPTVYANLSKFGEYVSFPSSVMIVALVFMFYHWGVYGFADVVASTSVLMFGISNCILVYLFRSLTISNFWHFGNNFWISLSKLIQIGAGG